MYNEMYKYNPSTCKRERGRYIDGIFRSDKWIKEHNKPKKPSNEKTEASHSQEVKIIWGSQRVRERREREREMEEIERVRQERERIVRMQEELREWQVREDREQRESDQRRLEQEKIAFGKEKAYSLVGEEVAKKYEELVPPDSFVVQYYNGCRKDGFYFREDYYKREIEELQEAEACRKTENKPSPKFQFPLFKKKKAEVTSVVSKAIKMFTSSF